MTAGTPVTKRIVVVANKTFEVAPLIGVLTDPNATKGPYLTVPSDAPAGLRGSVDFGSCIVEIHCLQDTLPPDLASDSSAKYEQLPNIIGSSPDLVVAFGTAATRLPMTLNGCAIFGARVFLHNTDPTRSPWGNDNEDRIIASPEGEEILASAFALDTQIDVHAEAAFLATPNAPFFPTLLEDPTYVALADLNAVVADYTKDDRATLAAFDRQPGQPLFGTLETTHGLIRLRAGGKFIFVSGVVNRIGKFGSEVTPRFYAQNFVAAHNAGIALASALPALVKSLP